MRESKTGRIIYAPKPLIDFVDEISCESKLSKSKSMKKIVHDAKSWRELERTLKRAGLV